MTERVMTEHIATGGTIDSVWSPEADSAIPASVSVVGDYLDFLNDNGFPAVDSVALMMKDSRQITIADKEAIAKRVAESRYPRTLVTSGTYLMREIGERIQRHPMSQHFERFGHRVAITSSLIPLDGYYMSDGGFNVGMAMAALDNRNTPSEVVGVANGMISPVNLLEKDLTTATFEPLDSTQSLLEYTSYTLLPAGGTIDFEINGTDGMEPAGETAVAGYLRNNVRSNVDFFTTPPILKDSRNLTSQDMDMVVDILRASTLEHAVVTSGLVKMAELRRIIEAGLHTPTDQERKIVLTGSKFVLRMAGFSDAGYNLGYAHGRLGDVSPGAHIAVNSRVLDHEQDPMDICYAPDEASHLLSKLGQV